MDHMAARMDDQITGAQSENERLREEIGRLRHLIGMAYGFLWCVNNEPGTPVAVYPPERAAYEARKLLRDTMTHEQRGNYINLVLPIVRCGA